MAGNILSAIIDVTAPGVEQEAKKVSNAMKDVKASMQSASVSVDGVAKSTTTAKSVFVSLPPAIQPVGNSIDKVTVAAARLDAQLKKLPNNTNQSTNTLLNLGRVAQDAPFGFIGIANNINPLLESFQRLKATTGSTGGALKALGGSLLGPAGLGVGVSIVSSLLLVFGDRLFGASKKSKELDEANQKLAEGVASQAAKLTVLVGIVKNVSATYDDKQKALRAINQEYAQYLPNLNAEAVTLGNIDTAYKSIVDSLLRQAVVKGLQEEIAKAVEETAKQIISLERAEQKRRQESSKTETITSRGISQEADIRNAIRQTQGVVSDATINRQQFNAEVRQGIAIEDTFEKVLQRTKDGLFQQLKPLLELTTNFEDLGIKLDKLKDKKDIAITPELLSPDVSKFISTLSTTINSGKTFDIDGILERSIQAIDSARLREIVNLQLFNIFDKEFAKFGQEPPDINVNIDPVINQQKLQAALAIIEQRFNNAKVIAEGLSGAVGQTFDAIANGEDVVKALVGSFKQLVVQIAKSVIQAIVFNAIMNAILPGSGGAGKTVGSIIGGFAGFRAGGGPVQAGRGYIVGENGPEWFQPNAGGTIIPSSQVGGAMAAVTGGNQQLVARVYGRDLLFILTQAAGASNRLS